MPNIVEFVSGEGIIVETDPSNGNMKFINSEMLTKNQKDALDNDKASDSNKYITNSEVDAKIEEKTNGPDIPPKDFPIFFTNSTQSFIIPKTGRYRISAVGGGGSGAVRHVDISLHGKNGNDTKIIIAGETYIAKGGAGGKYYTNYTNLPLIDTPYDGTKGSTRGGIYVGSNQINNVAENGHGLGGGYCGGGGSPLNYKTFIKIATASILHKTVGNSVNYETLIPSAYGQPGFNKQYVMRAGYGYGAGSGACADAVHYNVAGGNSGFLITKELQLTKGTSMKIIIGAGGSGVSGTYVDPHSANGITTPTSGNGAQGAVLLEWISKD